MREDPQVDGLIPTRGTSGWALLVGAKETARGEVLAHRGDVGLEQSAGEVGEPVALQESYLLTFLSG